MKLEGIQAGRAIAALLVVAFHANVFIIPDRLFNGRDAGALFNFGYAGVEFFFVLSGFIMVFVHRKDFSVPHRASQFLLKRILRIYPIYWVIYLGLTALYFVDQNRGPENARDLEAIIASLLLWPSQGTPVMQIAWTLQHEMLFYLVFTILVLNLKVGIVVFIVWMTGCFFASVLQFPDWNLLLSSYNLLFVFGIGAGLWYGRLEVTTARITLIVGATIFLGVGLSEVLEFVDWNKPLRTWCYGIGAMFVVAGLAASAVSPPKWLVLLGDASYAIYLVHLPAMTIGVSIAKAVGAPWNLPPLAIMLALIFYSTLAGVVVHLTIERPLAEHLKPLGKLRSSHV